MTRAAGRHSLNDTRKSRELDLPARPVPVADPDIARMHREISHVDPVLERRSNLSLYLLTALIGSIMAIDLWPRVAAWLAGLGVNVPDWARWSQEVGGYRIVLLAAILGGARVLFGALESLLQGRLGADLALALACVAAILMGEPLVAAEIVFIGLVGECLESLTFERTQRAIQRIAEVFPRRCWVLRDGQEVRVFTGDVQAGDCVLVKPGGKVPVDGVVIEGGSAVDQSALTGESLPVEKKPGDEVLAGSINQLGALTIRTRRVAQQTVAGRVIELTRQALKDKAPLERTADKLARYFLPAVLSLAALTLLVSLGARWLALRPDGKLGWGDVSRSLYPALSVLVVACPCALILATPAAIMAALGRLAGTGVLIKGGSALERLASVTAFAFDKTGTLTEGRLELGDLFPLNGVSAEELLNAAATAEQKSEHVLARVLIQAAAQRGLIPESVEEFVAHPGAGVVARTPRGTLIVGSQRLLEEQCIAPGPEIRQLLERLDQSGQTALMVARDGVVLGIIGARDRPRPEAAGVIAELQQLGIRDVALLSGDRPAVAHAVADTLGITEVHAGLLPQQKADFIAAWQKQHKVAMVGDGINDAPALARADVGLALGGTGTDIAAEAGDLVLMGDPLRPLPLLLRLSRETVRIIHQNIIIFAFAVNALGIVLTAWLWPLFAPPGWYEQSPLVAVIYHQIGSLAVLLNAMRLLWFERAPSSPAWQRFRGALHSADQWLEQRASLHDLLHWLEDHARPVLAGLAGLLFALYALSGLVQVGPDELAVVRRFGEPIADLGPGLHWRWPWPVEDTVRLQPARVHAVDIGFRSLSRRRARPGALAWSSPHEEVSASNVGEEALMITGDGDLVELQATVRYIIADPHVYLFSVGNVDTLLRAIGESVLRQSVAAEPFLDLLTSNREVFQQQVLARIHRRCAAYGGLGIRLSGLTLQDVHPPQEVVAGYHEVTRAMAGRERQIKEAEAEAARRVAAAEATALHMGAQARATAHEIVSQAEAAHDAFLARLTLRTRLSFSEEARLLAEGLASAWRYHQPALAFDEYQRKRQQRLAAAAALTDFRLLWDTLTRALAGRDKVIIDAEQVPGRRHLLFLDAEQLRLPAPLLTAPERGPRNPRNEEPKERR
ncbi:MAG TPA: cation-translocating P-type ATPase family protein [Gemmataceae bacterium]|nr:cation-translocating P-type ATPase family protein [Gemmataceae bacterium]